MSNICYLCSEPPKHSISLSCEHTFCSKCLKDFLNFSFGSPRCPECFKLIEHHPFKQLKTKLRTQNRSNVYRLIINTLLPIHPNQSRAVVVDMAQKIEAFLFLSRTSNEEYLKLDTNLKTLTSKIRPFITQYMDNMDPVPLVHSDLIPLQYQNLLILLKLLLYLKGPHVDQVLFLKILL